MFAYTESLRKNGLIQSSQQVHRAKDDLHKDRESGIQKICFQKILIGGLTLAIINRNVAKSKKVTANIVGNIYPSGVSLKRLSP